MRYSVFIAFGTLLFSAQAEAAGFLIMNHGARSTGRANAFVATADDPSAIYHNPAGITQIKGYSLYVGANLVAPQSRFRRLDGSDRVKTDTGVIPSPHGYLTAQLNELVTFGLGVNPPYGLTVEWPSDSPGRDLVREQELRTWFITPVVAVDFSTLGVEGLSLAAGADIVPASVFLDRDLLFGDTVGQVQLSGSDVGLGGRFGMHYRPEFLPALSFGAMFRLPVSFNFDGQADFDIEDPVFRQSLPPDGDGGAELTVPYTLNLGLAYTFDFDLQLEANVNFVGWSAYDELPIRLPDGTQEISRRNYEDRTVYRFGVEYAPGTWAVRAGYAFDPTPVPDNRLDFTLPDADRNIVSAGVGWELNQQFYVDLAGWYFIPTTRATGDAPNEPREKGEFKVEAWVASLSFGFRLDS